MSSVFSSYNPSVPIEGSEHHVTDETKEMIIEMAALGLPHSFIARAQGSTRKSRKKSSTYRGTTNKHEPPTVVSDLNIAETTPSPKFCVHSVRLYSPEEPILEVEEHDLDGTTQTELEASSISEDVESRPDLKTEISQARDEADVLRLEGSSGADRAEVNGGTNWEPVWDQHYQCYYFFNSQTSESTWEPPPGFEQFIPSSFVAAQNNSLNVVNSFVVARDYTLPDVSLEGTIYETERDLDLRVCSEEGTPSSLPSVPADRSDVGVMPSMLRCEEGKKVECDELLSPGFGLPSDLNEQTSAIKEIDSPSAIRNVHIRFSDNEETSISSEAGEDGRIDWEEIHVERSTRVVGDEDKEEGCEACSPSSLHWLSFTNDEVKQRIKPSRKGIKKRRLRSLSGSGELDNLLPDKVLPGMEELMSRNVLKYWLQRYSLFGKYDKGIKMDEEGWFSVTPEAIAKHHASRCATGLVIDAFTGVGGNAIQFALKCSHVIAIDIDPVRVEYARHNAEIYGVSNKIEFIIGDFFQLAPSLKADVVFLSPPWGGPEYLKQEVYDLHTMLQPKDGCTLFKVAQSIAPNIALFVPRNVNLNQLQELSWLTSPPLPCEVEENFVNDRLKAITAYYGEMASQDL